MAALLLRRSPRSDDLERGEPGPPLHPITGTFADANHTRASRSASLLLPRVFGGAVASTRAPLACVPMPISLQLVRVMS